MSDDVTATASVKPKPSSASLLLTAVGVLAVLCGPAGLGLAAWTATREVPAIRTEIQQHQPIKVVDINHLMAQLESWSLSRVDKLIYLDLFIGVAKAEGTLVLNGAATLVVPSHMIVRTYPGFEQIKGMADQYGVAINTDAIKTSMSAGDKAKAELDTLLNAQ